MYNPIFDFGPRRDSDSDSDARQRLLAASSDWGCADPPCWERVSYVCAVEKWRKINGFIAGLAGATAELIEQLIGNRPRWISRLRQRVRELCRVIGNTFCRYHDACITDLRTAAVDCHCIDDYMDTLYYKIDDFFQGIRDAIRDYVRAVQAQEQAQAGVEISPGIIKATVAAAMVLVGAMLVSLLTEGVVPVSAEMASLIIAAFNRERHPDLEEMIEGWAEDYLENQLPMSDLSVSDVDTGVGDVGTAPLTTPTIGELAVDPTSVAQAVCDLHVSEIEAWLAEWATREAQAQEEQRPPDA